MTPRTMRRVYLREAAVMLVLARLAVRFVPTAHIFAWADRPPRRIRRFATDEIAWVSWAVENLGAKSWMNALCLPREIGDDKIVGGSEADGFTRLATFGGALP